MPSSLRLGERSSPHPQGSSSAPCTPQHMWGPGTEWNETSLCKWPAACSGRLLLLSPLLSSHLERSSHKTPPSVPPVCAEKKEEEIGTARRAGHGRRAFAMDREVTW